MFGSLGHQAFLETVRELVAAEPLPIPKPEAEPTQVLLPAPPAADSEQTLATAAVQFLEVLAAVGVKGLVTTDANGRPTLQVPLPSAEVLRRGTAALRAILSGLEAASNGEGTRSER